VLTDEKVTDGVQSALQRAVELGEVGVQVAAYLGNELIVDSWIGETQQARETPVDGGSIFPIFSVTKAVTALAVHIQAERGLIEYDAPLARYWPEYAAHGKERITVAHVLAHRAGVPQMPDEITPELMCDWDWVTRRLAELAPVFEPGTKNSYLSFSYGWLLGEVVQRTDPQGRSFGRFVQEELCEPLGIDSLWVGVPASEEHRLATLSADRAPPRNANKELVVSIPTAVAPVPEIFNRKDVLRACMPSANGVANARSCARLFAMIANRGELDGVRILSEERVLSFLEPRQDYEAPDVCYPKLMPVGVGGLLLDTMGIIPDPPMGRVLCSVGGGNTFWWADVDTHLAFGICHNRLRYYPPDPPFAALAEAVWRLAADCGGR
jgi:CubicO group peptidase (beta-lactamase class C family)